MAPHSHEKAAAGPFAALGPDAWIERIAPQGARVRSRGRGCVALWTEAPAARRLACGLSEGPSADIAWAGRPDLGDLGAVLMESWTTRSHGDLRGVPGPLSALVWDDTSRSLHAFRDRLGQYPLFYLQEAERIVVGPDPARLLELMELRPQADVDALRRFLLQRGDFHRSDFLRGVRWIRPGERMRWSPEGRRDAWLWWTPTRHGAPLTDLTDVEEAAEAVAEAVDREIASALIAGPPPVGLLSGGVDSSVLMARLSALAGAAVASPLEVYSLVSPQMPGCDERDEIEQIAAALSLRVHFVCLDELWALRELGPYQEHWSLGPIPLPNDNTLNYLFDAVARDHTGACAMTGVGADQLFAGTRSPALRAMLHRRDLQGLWREAGASAGEWLAREVVRHGLELVRLADPVRELRRRWWQRRDEGPSAAPIWQEPARWVRGEVRDAPSPEAPATADPSSAGANRARRSFHRNWDWEHTCRTTFRASLAGGAPGLHPFMSAPLWELAARLDDALLYRDGLPKPVLRQIGRNALPAAVVGRPKRQHFGKLAEKGLGIVEVEQVRELLNAPRLAELGLINPSELRRAYEAYAAAVSPVFPAGPDIYSLALWRTIAAELWLRALPATL